MKTVKKTLGWLVVAAALTMGMSACSSDADSIVEPTIQEPAPTSLHITVGAGIANDNATTRADVVDGKNTNGKATHTLVFTTGDRLFFQKLLENGKFLTGWLTMDGSPSSDGLSATFSGTVKPYNLGGEEISYNLSGIDPLAGSNAYLMPSGAAEGCFSIPHSGVYGLYFNESYSIAADVNTLMKTALYVKGDYNSTQQRFNLTKQFPILNCALGGLTPNTAYTVKLRWAREQTYYENNFIVPEIAYTSTVTTDADGIVHFAISGNNDELTENRYWIVQLSDGEQTKDYVIGQKTFEPKVYNLTRDLRAYTPSAFSSNQAGTEQYIYNTLGLTEATWSTHTDYGLAKFKIMLTDKDGMGLGNMKFSHFTINDGNGHTYNIRTGTDDPDFDDTTQFYVATVPTSTTPATVTYNSGTKTYVGTIPNFVSTGGVVSNFGIIELREQ